MIKNFEEIDLEKKIDNFVKRLIKTLKKRKLFLATMESCTGGALINAITNIPGASEIIKGGFVPYSIQEKITLGIPKKIIEKYTVYSPEVAIALAKKAVKKIKGSDIGIGITGILSRPDPKFPGKKVGQVDIGVTFENRVLVKRFYFPSKKERKLAKAMIILKVLEMIKEIIMKK